MRRLSLARRVTAAATTSLLALGLLTTQAALPHGIEAAAAATTPTAPPAAVNPDPTVREVTTPGPTAVTASMTADTVWGPTGSPYVITTAIQVRAGASLTMLPGTVVKFGGATSSLTAMFGAQLLVLGSPNQHVTITSLKDDTVLGDTNGDGDATRPAPGDWSRIHVWGPSTGDSASAPAPASVIDYADVRYGGYDSDPAAGQVATTYRTNFVMSHSTLSDSMNAGFHDLGSPNAAVGLYDNTFVRNATDLQLFSSTAEVIGNYLGATTRNDKMRGAAAYITFPYKVRFQFNDARGWVTVNGSNPQPTRAQADVRFNTLAGGAGGWYPGWQDLTDWSGNWWGYNSNNPLPRCMSPAAADAKSPPVRLSYTSSTCPSGSYPTVGYAIGAMPALSGSPRALSPAAREAAAPRSGPVNTFTGELVYQAADLAVADAGKQLSATRTYRSGDTRTADAGRGWSVAYGEQLVPGMGLATVNFSDGSSAEFASDPAAGYTPDRGSTADFASGDSGSSLTTADRTTYSFDADGELTGLTLGDSGHRIDVVQDHGRVTSVAGVSGRDLTFHRDGGRLTGVEDSAGRTAGMHYTGDRLTSVTGVDGETESYEYDADGRLTRVTSPSGTVELRAGYRADGRVEWVELPGAGRRTFGYDDDRRTRTITDALGTVTTQEYDDLGRAVTERTGRSGTHVVYDGDGRVVTTITGVPGTPMTGYAPSADVAFFDGHGDPYRSIDAVGIRTSTTFNGSHQPLVTTRSDGSKITRTYDAQQRLETVTDPVGQKWTYAHDDTGQLVSATDPLGRVRRATYSVKGDPASTTDESGATTTFVTDGLGRITRTTDPLGHHRDVTYTSFGLPATTTVAGATTTTVYDVDRRQSAVTDAVDHTSRVEYDAAGRVTATVDPLGRRTENTYDEVGRPVAVRDAADGVTRVTYSAEGWITSITDPTGMTTSFSYDPAGRVHRVTYAGGAVRQTAYNRTGQITDVWTPDGARERRTYDSLGRQSAVTDPLGWKTSYAYDAAGRPTVVTDPLGFTTSRGYDAAGRVTSETDRLGTVTSYAYDDRLRQLTASDAAGVLSTTRHDPAGQVSEQVDATGIATAYGYDAAGRVTSESGPSGELTYAYDAVGNVVARTDGSGRRTTYTYDAAAQLTSATTPAGRTTYDYDATGNLLQTVDREGGSWTSSWDAAHRLLTSTDPLGAVTTYTYDANGRQASVTDPTGVVLHTAYDAVGRPAVRWDASGASWVTRYDLSGNVTSTADPDGATETFTYSKRNDVLTAKSGSASAWSYVYDADQRLTSSNEGAAVQYAYDARDRVTAVTDALGNRTQYGYDAAGRRTSTTTPSGKVTTYRYDGAGRIESVTDPLNSTATYAYAADGALGRITLPSGGSYTFAYDAAGRLASQATPELAVTQYAYDAEGRPTAITPPSGRTTTAAYDLAGNRTSLSAGGVTRTYGYDGAARLTSASAEGTDPSSFDYDDLGRLVSSTDAVGTSTYTYTAGGRLAGRTAPGGGPTLTYGYNDRGLVATVRGAVNWNFAYNKAGQVTTQTPVAPTTGWSDSRSYDTAGRLTGMTGGAPATFAYTADGQISRISAGSSIEVKRITDYGYDVAGHLTSSVTTKDGATLSSSAYTYDADGNRTGASADGQPAVTSRFDAAGQLVDSSDGRTYAYDADGRMVSDGDTTYSYNAFGELTGTEDSGGSVTYERDALGRTASRAAGGNVQAFTYDGTTDLMAASLGADGRLTALLRTPGGQLLGQATTGLAARTAALNVHGDLVGLKDHNASTVRWTAGYDAYGNQQAVTGSAAVALGYQGMFQDPATGLVDMAARAYDPGTGRFTSLDTVIGDLTSPTSLNRYGYGFGDPVNYVDPDGHWPDWLDSAVSTVWNGIKAGASAVTKAVTKAVTSVGNGIAKAAAAVRPAVAEAVDAVQDVAQSAAAFYERNKTQINAVVASATVGLVAYAGCTAMSFGTGAVACAGVAGAAGGAVYGAMTCPEGTSRTQCAAVGAVSGALGGVTAGGLAAAGVGLAGVGAGSAAASNVADQVMRTGEVDPKELLVSTIAGGAVGGLGGALGRAVGGPRASSLADDFRPGRPLSTPAKPSTSPVVKEPAPKTEPRTVAIGEDMEGRVIPFAQRSGADWYKPAPDAPSSMWMENNRRWINDRMDEGCRILDCGAAPGRPNHPRATSPYYQMELDEIAKRGYPDYSRVDID